MVVVVVVVVWWHRDHHQVDTLHSELRNIMFAKNQSARDIKEFCSVIIGA
jgi:hypothetical protein